MLTWELFRHYLLSKRAGSVIRIVSRLCMVGVAVGVMALVIVLSVMNGFNGSIQRRLLAVEPHLIATIPGAHSYQDVQAHPAYVYLQSQKDVQAQIFESQDIVIRTVDGSYGGGVAKGVEPQALGYIMRETQKAEAQRRSLRHGEEVMIPPVSDESTHLEAGEVLLGIDLAHSLGVFEGDKIVVVSPEALLLPAGEVPPFEKVTVKGLLSTNIPEIDGKAVFYGREKTFTRMVGSPSRQIGIEIRLPDANDFAKTKLELEKRGATVSTWIERNSSLFYALRMEKMVMGIFLGLSALIASFSIITVLVLLLTQKRKDIGVLMAMGLSPSATRRAFAQVGLLLSTFGLGGGLILGLIVCYLIQHFPMPILPDIYYDSTIPAKVDPLLILCIVVAASIIAGLSAWLPARRHTASTPSEALRGR
jgi:lipoprotein-releasing system permease protein